MRHVDRAWHKGYFEPTSREITDYQLVKDGGNWHFTTWGARMSLESPLNDPPSTPRVTKCGGNSTP